LITSARSSTTATGVDAIFLRYNSDTGSNYAQIRLYGEGTTPDSNQAASSTFHEMGRLTTSNSSNTNPSPAIFQIFDYSITNKFKLGLGKSVNILASVAEFVNTRWSNTSAITSITLTNNSTTNFVAGSTFALYGIVS
jgi:hypothetical protein